MLNLHCKVHLVAMARQVRIEYPGARYHVMSRGDHQEAVSRDDEDRERFLRTLKECCAKTGWVHAYGLMGNHYHLLSETPEPNLVTGMKWFRRVYTQRSNGRHKLFGHLFQGRYRALLVEPEGEYFATSGSYIHRNSLADIGSGRIVAINGRVQRLLADGNNRDRGPQPSCPAR
jgi:putative transposase